MLYLLVELIDLGFDTDSSESRKSIWCNQCEEDVADDRAIGRLTGFSSSPGIPGTVGFKLASGAVTAKKAGNYANLAGPNIKKH